MAAPTNYFVKHQFMVSCFVSPAREVFGVCVLGQQDLESCRRFSGCLLPVHSLLEKSGGIIKCLHHPRHDFANAMVFEDMEVIVDGHSAVFQRHGFDETHTAVGGVDGIRQLRHTAATTESEMGNANACHIGPGRRKEEIVALVEHEMPTCRQHTVYAAVTATDFLYDLFLYVIHDAMVR